MRSRVVGTCFGVLALTSACATSTGTMASGANVAPTPEESSRSLSAAERDSLLAQTVADREGPGVDIRADILWVSNSRRVQAHFNLHDDAYVLVGQIDPDGNVRVMFPTDPKDDGFARGDHSYTTEQAFAGFEDQYRYRFNNTRYTTGGYHPDSYDGSIGYMFVIASWRPMHFDQLSSNGTWDTYELANDDYLRDPRPAIYELASLLAGDNREAYTVKFAQYFNTQTLSVDGLGTPALLYDNAFCSGFGEPIGYFSSPFNNPIFASQYYGESFFYRGSYYQYNYAGDCYTQGIGTYFNPLTYGLGFSPWGAPGTPAAPAPGLFSAVGHRSPLNPRPVHPPTLAPGAGSPVHAAGLASAERPRYNPEYRNRGLMTADDPTAMPGRRETGNELRHEGFATKPSIQDMVSRHMQDDQQGVRGWMHNQRFGNEDGNGGTVSQHWAHADNANGGNSGSASRPAHASGEFNDGARYSAPRSSWDGGRSEPRGSSNGGGSAQGRSGSQGFGGNAAPAPRSEPHYSAPASAPAVHSAPAASAPASSSSSSKPPV